ncbi:DUF4265 domain-containing protein [Corallococcus silvisoli]|uniref:DUF4265 domain-containing protein n=1 Tax=Corallococcus silvisoli TaxID=2697031 RepID=UPI001376883B|nr:DUF4265 domain-containing protein [Corallococcus silvisoli]NBD08514.1 DUF4265 domain-containing protein [Corallococcus silvisoli]
MEIALNARVSPGSRPLKETLPIEQVGGHYRLLYSPGLVEGLAAGDEIELVGDGGFTVLKRGGNFCIWFFFPAEGMNRGPETERMAEEVSRLGGWLDGGGETVVIFTVPAAVGFDRMADYFDEAVSRVEGASWMFANAYDPISKAPLSWWQR